MFKNDVLYEFVERPFALAQSSQQLVCQLFLVENGGQQCTFVSKFHSIGLRDEGGVIVDLELLDFLASSDQLLIFFPRHQSFGHYFDPFAD